VAITAIVIEIRTTIRGMHDLLALIVSRWGVLQWKQGVKFQCGST